MGAPKSQTNIFDIYFGRFGAHAQSGKHFIISYTRFLFHQEAHPTVFIENKKLS